MAITGFEFPCDCVLGFNFGGLKYYLFCGFDCGQLLSKRCARKHELGEAEHVSGPNPTTKPDVSPASPGLSNAIAERFTAQAVFVSGGGTVYCAESAFDFAPTLLVFGVAGVLVFPDAFMFFLGPACLYFGLNLYRWRFMWQPEAASPIVWLNPMLAIQKFVRA